MKLGKVFTSLTSVDMKHCVDIQLVIYLSSLYNDNGRKN